MRESYPINQLIARKGNELFVAEEAFRYDSGLMGVTGLVVSLVADTTLTSRLQDWVDNSAEYFWRESVAIGATTQSLEDWTQTITDDMGWSLVAEFADDRIENLLWDHYKTGLILSAESAQARATLDLLGLTEDDLPVEVFVEVIAGGRIFHGDEYDQVYNADWLERINRIEAGTWC